MRSSTEEIKSRLDIVEFIQGYVRLQKAGVNFRANCPLHSEKTPSFYVTPSRQMWHCFGCGKGGDIFQFVMEMEGHDFPEALKLLADRTGVEIKREDPRIRSERNRLYDINSEAAIIFEKSLTAAQAARNYLSRRGLAKETITQFRVGFAPDSWNFLVNALIKKGFRNEEIERAGLAIKQQERGTYYDRFRSRIMFPIADASGRIIGFGGRIFEVPLMTGASDAPSFAKTTERAEAKYMNTPQTMIYDKSAVLYGFDHAKKEIHAKNCVVLVEGYMDCVMSHQAGIANTVAVSGTALTSRQLQMLRRICDKIISSFDTDAAGESATRRSLALASEFDFERRVAHIHTGKDPADAVSENPQLWREAVEQAKPVMDFYVEKAFREHDPSTVDGKKAITAMVFPFLQDIFDAIERDHWIKKIARQLDVGEESIASELARRRENAPESGMAHARDYGNTEPEIQLRVQNRRNRLEEKFLTLLAMMPEETRSRAVADHYIDFLSAEHQNIFALITVPRNNDTAGEKLSEQEMFQFKSEVLTADVRNSEQEFLICKRELEKECIKEKMQERQQEIAQQERAGNTEAVADLLKEIINLHKVLKQLSAS